MKIRLVYPRWPKLKNQPVFHLPPVGPTVFAASLPRDVEVEFIDENVEPVVENDGADIVAISAMLTCQMPRAFEIADGFRARGKTVLMGGIGAMLHPDEAMQHVDSLFLGESEGRIERVLHDFERGQLKRVYDHMGDYPDTALIGPARRDILKREFYNYRGIQMMDLIHASRGCRFNCFPCCTPYLGGRNFRPRPIDRVIEEMAGIPNNRLFLVDNSLCQDDAWEKDLFRAMAPLKKKWVSHPIKDDDEILALAAEAGCWYVYQAIFDTSDYIRDRIRRYKSHGIGVEGTIILGTDEHDQDEIRRLVDFLLEIDLDLAEFTVLTPFPQTSIRASLAREGRILHDRWISYTAGEVVFRPARMTPEQLQEMYEYAWAMFYRDWGKEMKMGKLFLDVLKKERADGTIDSLGQKGEAGRRRRPATPGTPAGPAPGGKS